jgi:hypothetical protein
VYLGLKRRLETARRKKIRAYALFFVATQIIPLRSVSITMPS